MGSKPLPSRKHVHYVADSTGIGKTFLARAFGQKACRDGFTAYFATAAQLFRELELGRADGSYDPSLRDGEITSRDAIFRRLRLWRDSNGDGIAQAAELLATLSGGEQRGGTWSRAGPRREMSSTGRHSCRATSRTGR